MRILLEHGGVALEQFIWSYWTRPAAFQGLFLPPQPQGQDHLVLPQGDGVVNGTLDAVDEDLVVVLDDPDLRRRLNGNGLADFRSWTFFSKRLTEFLKS